MSYNYELSATCHTMGFSSQQAGRIGCSAGTELPHRTNLDTPDADSMSTERPAYTCDQSVA